MSRRDDKRSKETEINDKDRSDMKTEISLWILLFVSIILLLCVFNLCGPLSGVLGSFLFGMVGSLAYIFPIAMFLVICMIHLNIKNKPVIRKIIYAIALFVIIIAIFELLAGDSEGSIWNCYVNGYKTHLGGGIIGGCISMGLSAIMGRLATGILLFVAAIILLVLITGKMIASIALNNSSEKYNEYMKNRNEKKKRQEEDDLIDYDSITEGFPDELPENNRKRSKRQVSYTFPKEESVVDTTTVEETKNDVIVKEPVEELSFEEESKKKSSELIDQGTENSSDITTGKNTASGKETASADETEAGEDTGDMPIYEKEIVEKFGTDHPVTDNSLAMLVARALENDRVQYTEYTPYVDDEPEDKLYDNNSYNLHTQESSKSQDSYMETGASDSYGSLDSNNASDPYGSSGSYNESNAYDGSDSFNESDSYDESDSFNGSNSYSGSDSYDNSDSYNETESYAETVHDKKTSGITSNESRDPGSLIQRSTSSGSTFNTPKPAVNDNNTDEVTPDLSAEPIPYVFPSMDLLEKSPASANKMSRDTLEKTAKKLQDCLKSFKVEVEMTDIICGPTVTRYELKPALGTKVKKITELENDIKLYLAATDIRIEAPIPGKHAVGIEVPNKGSTMITLREMLETKEFNSHSSNVAFAVGKDIGGNNVIADIAKMPHMLIAGATGSGKSVCINTIIMSILYKADPNDVKLIMIDPKVVELSVYNGIPHLCIPVVTDPKKAAAALNWAVAEMNDRYKKFAEFGVRDMKGFNQKVAQLRENPHMYTKMPQIVIIVDELADLMMVASHDVEAAICRLAQMARAAGLHLIIATQRPSVDVITGLIKANVPSRIAFAVSSAIDSRTILDGAGAEKLLGKGDMLFKPQDKSKAVRVQGAFVSDSEVARVTDFVKGQYSAPVYDMSISEQISNAEMKGSNAEVVSESDDSNPNGWDEKFEEAGRFIIEKQKASIGTLQRVFKIGFNRGARIMDQLCEAGVVSEEDGKKPRNILMTMEEFEQFMEDNR